MLSISRPISTGQALQSEIARWLDIGKTSVRRLLENAQIIKRPILYRVVAISLQRLVAKASRSLQKQRGLSHLPRPGEKLDAGRRRFAGPCERHFAAGSVGILNLSHSLIIIRLFHSENLSAP